ncbi:MAG: hypothetical protein EOP50_06280, partial [Sphingobacteriales bacterium]
MNIVLYEHEHFELLDAFVAVFAAEGRRLHLLLTPGVLQMLDSPNPWKDLDVTVQLLPAVNAEHPAAVEALCKKTGATLLLLGTVSFRHGQFAAVCRRLQPRVRVCLGIHDVNELFAGQRPRSLRDWVRAFGRKRLRRAINAFWVPLEEMRAHLLQTYKPGKPVYVLPGSFWNGYATGPDYDGAIRLSVAGSIDSRRRDYSVVETLAEQLFRETTDPEISILMLGTPTDHAPGWIDRFPGVLAYEPNGFLTKEYEAALRETELLWLPLQPVFRRPGHPDEAYGLSKSSGVFFDALRHGKPLLLHDDLPVPGIVASAVLQYS